MHTTNKLYLFTFDEYTHSSASLLYTNILCNKWHKQHDSSQDKTHRIHPELYYTILVWTIGKQSTCNLLIGNKPRASRCKEQYLNMLSSGNEVFNWQWMSTDTHSKKVGEEKPMSHVTHKYRQREMMMRQDWHEIRDKIRFGTQDSDANKIRQDKI